MAESKVYIAVHGHFYQPPRENPYLDAIEKQDSAQPFHDWNERIFYECYRPNAFARIHNQQGELLEIVNNYEFLSFNMGPTLLSWLEKYDRRVYERILEGDRLSAQRLNGHGNAIAQVYNHIIMPLASWRDKLTQIRWGKADFRARFGREPEGMWLAETAIDYETVEALIQEGIRFTILAPSQAQRIRPIVSPASPEPEWIEVSGGQIDPTRPYRCFLKDRQEYLDVFFYDGPISRDMGFGDLLSSSYGFACRLSQAIQGDGRPAQLIAVATDGETFGHHKHFTDKSLAYAFRREFPQRGWIVTNFAHYLSLYPPEWEVVLKPVTAWSCAHGVDRWQEDCGCGVAVGFGKWRRPLREALNWLRDRLAEVYQQYAGQYFRDPWSVRDQYIRVIMDRSQWDVFWQEYGIGDLGDAKRRLDAIRLLEMQRHSLLMFTSCGWFFEEISRPEGVQILRYASRAMDLAGDVAGVLLEEEFCQRLALCPSNVKEFGDGSVVYRRLVQTAKVSLEKIAVQYAISSLVQPLQGDGLRRLYCYEIQQGDYELRQLGALQLAVAQLQVTSLITTEQAEYALAVLHLGGDDFHCVLQSFRGRRVYEEIKSALWQALAVENTAGVVLKMQDLLGHNAYSLRSLPPEDRQKILHQLARHTLLHLDQLYAQVYRDNATLLASFQRDRLPAPPELKVAVEITLNNRLFAELEQLRGGNFLAIPNLQRIAQEARSLACQLRTAEVAPILQDVLAQQMNCLVQDHMLHPTLHHIAKLLTLAEDIAIPLNLDLLQEQFLSYMQSQVAVACPALVGVSKLSFSCAQPLCETISNEELQQLTHIGQRLHIHPTAWLPQP